MGGDYLGGLDDDSADDEAPSAATPVSSELRGIVPRAVEELFSRLREARAAPHVAAGAGAPEQVGGTKSRAWRCLLRRGRRTTRRAAAPS